MVLARILLEACVRANNIRCGLDAADRALASAGAVPVFEAETRRLRADFLAELGAAPEEVTTELRRAGEVAHRQGASAFALRIALTLLRYRRRCHDAAGVLIARQQLADVLATRARWYNSVDVRDATRLLRE
jgi:hypothetical protein